MTLTHQAPDALAIPRLRPLFADWLEAGTGRGRIAFAEAGREIGMNGYTVARYCLPFDDARRIVPTLTAMRRIYAYTDGVCTPDTFYPPDLVRKGVPAVLAAGRAL